MHVVMSGITHLADLLASMSPTLDERVFVFVTLPDSALVENLSPIATFQERERLTVICPQSNAERAKIPFQGSYRLITLNVHSSLDAVGFLAAVTQALARAEIPANAVSAFYHDHIFVPTEKAGAALDVLQSLARNSTSR